MRHPRHLPLQLAAYVDDHFLGRAGKFELAGKSCWKQLSTRDVPDYTIVGCNPAKVIREI
jgi:hypothetical protein